MQASLKPCCVRLLQYSLLCCDCPTMLTAGRRRHNDKLCSHARTRRSASAAVGPALLASLQRRGHVALFAHTLLRMWPHMCWVRSALGATPGALGCPPGPSPAGVWAWAVSSKSSPVTVRLQYYNIISLLWASLGHLKWGGRYAHVHVHRAQGRSGPHLVRDWSADVDKVGSCAVAAVL